VFVILLTIKKITIASNVMSHVLAALVKVTKTALLVEQITLLLQLNQFACVYIALVK
jgi:hypothetical protein